MAVSTLEHPLCLLLAALIAGASGCAAKPAGPGGDESDAIAADEVASRRSPVDAGALALGATVQAELARDAGGYAWTFALTAPATVTLRTGPAAASGLELDTVLYVYRQGEAGWGRAVARNDDTRDSLFAALTRRLDAGQYRVVVRGYHRDVTGAFALASECAGAGCGAPPDACLFGQSFYELRTGTAPARVASETFVTRVDQLPDALAEAQLVLAVQQSSHADVRTAAEALARVDMATVRVLAILDAAGTAAFTGYEYGAGDSSYGAIFARGTATLAASIHDGDFERCTARTPAR